MLKHRIQIDDFEYFKERFPSLMHRPLKCLIRPFKIMTIYPTVTVGRVVLGGCAISLVLAV